MEINSIRRFPGSRVSAFILGAFLSVVTGGVAAARSFNVLSNLTAKTGYDSVAPLLQGSDGNFYGTTSSGGNMSACQLNGCGTIFQITPSGTLTVLHMFSGDSDGSTPQSGLIEANGALYGTTSHGGGSFGGQQGTIFKVGLDGSSFTTLYTFSGGSDGGDAEGALLLGNDGNLYGTTKQGGQGQNTTCVPNGCGTIFSLATNGSNFQTLYQFSGPDGAGPAAGLIQDPGGNFYGTTANGGAVCDPTLTCGTVFEFQAGSVRLTTLHSFNATTEGASPDSPLVRGSDGTLYGTAQYGGNLNCGINTAALGCGTLYSVNGNTFTVLWTFQGTQVNGDGAQPFGGMIFGADGNLYGTTAYGGAGGGACLSAAGCGAVFSSTTTGTVQVLHSFTGSDGSGPSAALVESNGILYGTASYGGSSACGVVGCGVVYSLGISAAKTSTTTAVTVTPDSIQQGTTSGVTVSATVSPASGSGSPTGSVSFSNGSTQIGQATLSGGTATFSYNASTLTANTYSIIASYSGDNTFSASSSSPVTLTVTSGGGGQNSTTTTLKIAANPSSTQSDVGSNVTLTASVAHANGSAVPSGTVTFSAGSVQIGSAALSNGTATYSTSALAAGQYSVVASYSGDPNYAASSSTGGTLDVVDFTMSAAPATITIAAPGQSGTTTLTVAPMDGFNQTLSYSCAGLPAGANCSFSNAANGATMTISTTGSASAMVKQPLSHDRARMYALLLPGLLGLLAGFRKRNLGGVRVLALLCAAAICSACVGCGGLGSILGGGVSGGGNSGTPTGSSAVIVTATAGSLSHQTTITLNVQ